MIPVKVGKISYHPSSRSYAVILKDDSSKLFLPILVGSFEAQSIALALEVVDTPRPLTHDLICDMIKKVDATLDAVCLLYTSPSPRDRSLSRMPSSA